MYECAGFNTVSSSILPAFLGFGDPEPSTLNPTPQFRVSGFSVWGGGPHLTHRPLSSSFLGLPHRILNMNHKKELLRGLGVRKKQKP